jgi:L-aspartate oxidase
MALAALAGAAIRDPEFVQFHPTALDAGLDPAPLMSEALRGEGARLVDEAGRPFMQAFDPRGDLAPRDVVARAIHRRIASGEGVFLDGREAVGEHFPQAFPTAFKACMAAGIDPRRELIPIAPAAHYHMGGIEADEDGRTSLHGLYAVGECASTGVHGANRLASNSLLEAAVFGARAGRAAAADQAPASPLRSITASPDLPQEGLRTLRAAMARYAGVERDADGLERLMAVLDRLQRAHGLALPLIAARLVAQGAVDRRESRGAHLRLDHLEQAAPASTRIRLDQAALMAAE